MNVANMKVEVTEFKRNVLDGNISYMIRITKNNGESWTVEKRYSQFNELNG